MKLFFPQSSFLRRSDAAKSAAWRARARLTCCLNRFTEKKREVSVTARDGTTLKGDFYPAPNARATLLYFHGYRGTSADFCFCIRFFHSRGFNVLLPDQRAHGRSGGKYICFGVKERFDCLDWIKFAGEIKLREILQRRGLFCTFAKSKDVLSRDAK